MTDLQQVLDRIDELKTDTNNGFATIRADQKESAGEIVELRVEMTRMAVTQENIDIGSIRTRLNRIERLFLPIVTAVGLASHWIASHLHIGK